MPPRQRRSSEPAAGSTSDSTVELTDVSNLLQLRRYAAIGQVVYMNAEQIPGVKPMSQNDLAIEWWKSKKARQAVVAGSRARELSPSSARGSYSPPDDEAADLDDAQQKSNTASGNFSRALKRPTVPFLQSLDAVILGKAPTMSRAGGLAAFAARLEGVRNAENMEVVVAPLYQPLVLAIRNPPPIIFLAQASILLAEFEEPGRSAYDVESVHKDTLTHVVDGLILIGGLPPTPYSVDALLLLGGISRYAFALVRQRLHAALRTPLGFRVWRAISAVVVGIQQRNEESTAAGQAVRYWVKEQLEFSERLREYSLYPARSLDLELAISVPKSWSPPEQGEDWAGDLLRRRANSRNATLRERGTAAFGLWERAVDGGYQDDARAEIEDLIAAFREESPERPGLGWVAGTLQENLRLGKKIVTTWPDLLDEPCQKIMQEAGQQLDVAIPRRIRAATELLFQHAVIKNAGVYRRRAIDTLRASGWAAQVVPALRAVLKHGQSEPWLRCRALFVIGFMQERGEQVQGVLREACNDAWKRLLAKGLDGSQDSKVRGIEMHAALFAVGDSFGVPDPEAEEAANQIREQLDDRLAEMVAAVMDDQGQHLVTVGRALSYLLATTAHVRIARSRSMLEQLAEVRDPVTKNVADWGLRRFTEFGMVRQAHEVPFEPLDLDE